MAIGRWPGKRGRFAHVIMHLNSSEKRNYRRINPGNPIIRVIPILLNRYLFRKAHRVKPDHKFLCGRIGGT